MAFDLLNIKIDPEFKNFLPPLTPEELKDLRDNIIAEGFDEKLVVWHDGEDWVLIDGHNRYEIWKSLNDEFMVPEVETRTFKSRAAVLEWIGQRQTGRRNLTPRKASEIRQVRGQKYNATKKKAGRPKSNGESGHAARNGRTAEKLAEEFGVDERTIRRDGQYAAALEQLPPAEREAAIEANTPASEVIKKARPQKTPKAKALDSLKGAERSLGALQDNLSDARAHVKEAGLKLTGGVDAPVKTIFEFIKTAKGLCK